MSFAQAAALPTAGLTALYGLSHGGLLAAKRVLVTCCGTGGVGLYAVQLAHLSGARVTAAIPEPEHAALMEEYGTDHVATGDLAAASSFGPYHLVMATAGEALSRLAPRLMRPASTWVLYGAVETHATEVDEQASAERGSRLEGVVLSKEVRREPASEGLRRLLDLVEANALQPHVELEAGWMEIDAVIRQVLDRSFVGRAVLHL